MLAAGPDALVQQPQLVHELAHLLEPNHSTKFWNIIAVQVPEYEKSKKWLKEFGYRLEEDF